MKRLLFVFSVAVLFLGVSVFETTAQTKRFWVAPKAGLWRVAAKDENDTKWSGRITLSKRGSNKGVVKYLGYFYWQSEDKETSGREYFNGSFNRKSAKLFLKAYAVKNVKGELGVGDYVASVRKEGRNIFRGSWSGKDNIPGKWSAIWLKVK